jgi:hypothetical protein
MQMPLWVFPRFLKANLHRQSVKAQGAKINNYIDTSVFAITLANVNATLGI